MKCRRAPDLGTAHMKVEQVEKKFFQHSSWKKKKGISIQILEQVLLENAVLYICTAVFLGFFCMAILSSGKRLNYHCYSSPKITV